MTKDFNIPISAQLIVDIINASGTFKDTLNVNSIDNTVRLSDGFKILLVQDWLRDCIPNIKEGCREYREDKSRFVA